MRRCHHQEISLLWIDKGLKIPIIRIINNTVIIIIIIIMRLALFPNFSANKDMDVNLNPNGEKEGGSIKVLIFRYQCPFNVRLNKIHSESPFL